MVSRSGANLALLLLGSFRALAMEATEELAVHGFADFRPTHDVALRAIAGGGDNASELGRRLSISKQAAAKTIVLLEQRGYVERGSDVQDARRKRLQLTPRGFEVLRTGERIFDELRERWAKQVGGDRLEVVEAVLMERLKTVPNGVIELGWTAHDDDM